MDEKRRMSRVPFDIRAKIEKEGLEGFVAGVVDNISLNGALIHLEEKTLPFAQGDPVILHIHLAAEEPEFYIHAKGDVVRFDGEVGLAIHFNQVDLDSFVHLKNILSYNIGDHEKIMDELLTQLMEETTGKEEQ